MDEPDQHEVKGGEEEVELGAGSIICGSAGSCFICSHPDSPLCPSCQQVPRNYHFPSFLSHLNHRHQLISCVAIEITIIIIFVFRQVHVCDIHSSTHRPGSACLPFKVSRSVIMIIMVIIFLINITTIIINRIDGVGRVVLANRTVKAGEVVLEEDALVRVDDHLVVHDHLLVIVMMIKMILTMQR